MLHDRLCVVFALAFLAVNVASPAAAVPIFVAGVGCNGPFHRNQGNFVASDACDPPLAAPVFLNGALVDSAASSFSGPGTLRLMSSSQILALDVNQVGSLVIATQAFGEWFYDDFVVVGPPGSTVPVLAALNLQVSGALSGTDLSDSVGPLTSTGTGNAQFFFQIEIDGRAVGFGEVIRRFSAGSVIETVDGLLLDLYESGSEVHALARSQFLMLPVNQAFRVHVYANAGANAGASVGGTPADEFDFTDVGGIAISDFSATVQFPTTGPVFDLPPGYTLHSVSAGIVDNQVAVERSVPEPSSLLLLAVGLAALGARRFSGK